MTRYMYRAPVAVSKIVSSNLIPWDAHKSTLTLEYFHKKPRERRTITYSVFDFIGLLARHIPDKYFRIVRYSGLFSHKKRKQSIKAINEIFPPIQELHTMTKRPTNYRDRLIQSFRKDPMNCPCCRWVLTLVSLTFFSKKSHCFITKLIDTS